MARTLLNLFLGLTLAASAPCQDWLGALQRQVHALDTLVEAPAAPEIDQVDLFGAPFRLSDLRGRVVVLSFLDRDSVDEAVRWLERQTTWMLEQRGVSFVNVFYPGGISFLIPRGEVVHRIRQQVKESETEMVAGLPPEAQALLAEADIRWVVDWKRRVASAYPVERGRVNVFLLGKQGKIREVHRYDPALASAGVRRGVQALLARHEQEGPAGTDL